MEYGLIFLICFTGSMIQGSVGFGYALFGMALLPFFMPYKVAAVVILLSGFAMLIHILLRLRQHINVKLMLFPTLFSFVGSTIGVYILMHYSEQLLRTVLGILLIALSLYFIFFQHRVNIRPSIRNGIITGLLSGISGGMSNIDGPPLVIYYFSAAANKVEYNATIQATFFAGGLYTVFLHLWYGNITGEVIKVTILAIAGVTLGSIVGLRIFSKLDRGVLSKLIYSFMVIMGVMLVMK